MYQNQLRFTLEKGSKKHLCPRCSKKRFVRYIDVTNNNYLPSEYGRCDREAKCGYHLNPYQEGYGKVENNFPPIPAPPPPKPVVFFPKKIVEKTLAPDQYEKNAFVQFLLSGARHPFPQEIVEQVIAQYYICLLYTSPSPRDAHESRMPSSA